MQMETFREQEQEEAAEGDEKEHSEFADTEGRRAQREAPSRAEDTTQ